MSGYTYLSAGLILMKLTLTAMPESAVFAVLIIVYGRNSYLRYICLSNMADGRNFWSILQKA